MPMSSQDPLEDPVMIYLPEHPQMHVISASELLMAIGQAAEAERAFILGVSAVYFGISAGGKDP
jgi:hypothetical protein